jgi:pSer/pThr/pTyr-binding forkhead associated (FHA) protein
MSAPRQPAAKTSIESPQELTTVLLTALRADGSEAGTFQVSAPETLIGRETGGIFSGDGYLSPHHATLLIHPGGAIHAGGRAFIRDESSLNGVYRKLERDVPVELNDGTTFRIGQEIVRFEALKSEPPTADGVERFGSPRHDAIGRLVLVIGREQVGNAFLVPAGGMHLGRERGEVLFPEDGYVSGLHCRIATEVGQLYLTDLGSSNGTFVRIHGELELHTGDVLLMGQQLFRVTVNS